MPWPTVPVVTTGMDADTDTLPRADILDHTNKFNQLIAMRGVADGVCDLDASTLVPVARIPATIQRQGAALDSLKGLALVAGDVLYATGAGALQRIPKGTAGQSLSMNAAATAPEWVTPSSLVSETITTALGSTVIVSGLDIATHKGYRIEIEYKNGTTSAHGISLYINGLTTATDYYRQYVNIDGTGVVAGRANDAVIGGVDASSYALLVADLALTPGDFALANVLSTRGTGAAVKSHNSSWSKTTAIANITSITVTAEVADGIGIGTKIRIYRKDK